MKRITPEEVQAAYAATGLKPVQSTFYKIEANDKCACALTALFARDHQLPDNDVDAHAEVTKWAELEYGLWYFTGFAYGFDGNRHALSGTSGETTCGADDGEAVAAAVFGS